MIGFFNVDKPEGVSSAKIVAMIKRASGCKAGHMGTLDPMASGVLVVGIGNAVRLFDLLQRGTKSYRATFTFGIGTDTLDTTGTVTETGRVPSRQEIADSLHLHTGKIMQMPPKYSAKNINGERAYALSRKNAEFDLKPSLVNISRLELTGCSGAEYEFLIECSSGTYIRSIGRDIAAGLSTCAAMSVLRRTACGNFTIENAVKPEAVIGSVADTLTPVSFVLNNYERVDLDIETGRKLLSGQKPVIDRIPKEPFAIYCGDKLLGMSYGGSLSTDVFLAKNTDVLSESVKI